MSDFEKAMLSPTSVYKIPNEVVEDDTLSREQKLKILRQWEYDAHELQVAEDENMPGDQPTSMLHRIITAIHCLEKSHKDQ